MKLEKSKSVHQINIPVTTHLAKGNVTTCTCNKLLVCETISTYIDEKKTMHCIKYEELINPSEHNTKT